MARFVLCLLLLIPALARAEGVALPPGMALDVLKLSRQALIEEGTRLILGYGSQDAISAAGLELAIGHERATRRAAQAEQVLAADLNGDGAVTRAEMAVHAGTLSVRMRARALAGFAAADGDGDGRAELPEIMAAAQAYALERFDDGAADRIRALIHCDADRDGLVTLAELRAAGDYLAARAEAQKLTPAEQMKRDL